MSDQQVLSRRVAPDAEPDVVLAPWARGAARLTALWMVAFGLLHVYWLLDGRLGLPERRSIYEKPALVVIAAVAVPLCAVGAYLAESLTQPASARHSPTRRLRLIAATAALLIVHATPTIPTWISMAFGSDVVLDEDERFVTYLYEPVFMAGGLLCTAAFVGYRDTGVRLRRRGCGR